MGRALPSDRVMEAHTVREDYGIDRRSNHKNGSEANSRVLAVRVSMAVWT